MKFDELDAKMRVYETVADTCVLPGIHMVARIDGRNFTRLTKETLEFEAPFDVRFRDAMVATTSALMDCGFRVVYGYTQSDEISLLFHPGEATFGRKLRKFNSILAGEASATFSMELRTKGVFDCRISQLPSDTLVVDYFRWRHEDAHRNALNAHCYWSLRRQGKGPREATKELSGLSVAAKNELLFQLEQTNYNDLPRWQRRGTGLFWEEHSKTAKDPRTGESVEAERRRLRIDFELPMKDDYDRMIESLLRKSDGKP